MTHKPTAARAAGGAALLLGVAVLCGCATGRGEPVLDSIEVTLPSSEDQVRTALIEVLINDGYRIRRGGEQEQVIATEYRKEIDSIWDRLLVCGFGVNRSRVDAAITPADPDHTSLLIRVTYETKRYLWSSWRESTPALQQSAANQVRRLKNALGLL